MSENLCVRISPNTYLVEQLVDVVELDDATPIIAKGANHDVIIADVSGSMGGVVRPLFEDIAAYVRTLPLGHFVSFGKYSGLGQVWMVLANIKLESEATYEAITQTIMKHAYTVGMTNISGPLKTVLKDVVEVMKPFGHSFNLRFFTDGQSTEPYDTRLERVAILDACRALKPEIKSALFFGYGNWIDAQLLSDMAKATGGQFQRSFDVHTFRTSLDESREASDEIGDKVLVSVNRNALLYFSIQGNTITQYETEQDDDSTLLYTPTLYTGPTGFAKTQAVEYHGQLVAKKQRLFSVVESTDVPKNCKITTLTEKNFKASSRVEGLWKAAYAYTMLLNQVARTQEAMDLLSELGDKALVDKLGSARAPREHAAVEALILEAVRSHRGRMLSGYQKGCAPKPDAFCLLDALALLEADEKAVWFPYLRDSNGKKLFDYNVIALSQRLKAGVPTFEPDPMGSSRFKVKMTEGRPNIGLTGAFPGWAQLEGVTDEMNLKPKYRTQRFRTYNIIADGDPQKVLIPARLSDETFVLLSSKGVIQSYVLGDGTVVTPVSGIPYGLPPLLKIDNVIWLLDLSAVPVVNRVTAEAAKDGERLCRQLFKKERLDLQLKTLNFHYRLAKPLEEEKAEAFGRALTPTEVECLRVNRVDARFGYQSQAGDLEVAPASDQYTALEFDIKIAGLGGSAKVIEVVDRYRTGNKQTKPGSVMAEVLPELDQAGVVMKLHLEEVTKTKTVKGEKVQVTEKELTPDPLSNEQKALWVGVLEPLIEKIETEQKALARDIQAKLLSLLLSGAWFHGKSSREDCTFVLDVPGFPAQEFTVKCEPFTVKLGQFPRPEEAVLADSAA